MKNIKGFDELQMMMADFASAYLQPAWEKQKAGEKHQLPSDQQFYEVFEGFTEITSTLEALTLIEHLIRLLPPKSKRIDKDSYIKFLVGSYLQEMYILEQRLSAYANKISRMYHRPSLKPELRKIVYKPLEAIISIRGSHVHQRRFTDKRLDTVAAFALFRKVKSPLGEDLEFEYKLAQLEWVKRVKENNQETRKIIDEYCRLLIGVICKDGKIFLPNL